MSLMLNIGAMNYRADASSSWQPLTILANADIPAVAAAFDSSLAYDIDQYVIYENYLYRCIAATSSEAAWNSTEWTMVTVGDELTALKTETKNDVLYFADVACAAATGDIATVSNSAISSDHVLTSCVFAAPSRIISDITWTTSTGSCVLNGTCTSATTVNIVLIKKDN